MILGLRLCMALGITFGELCDRMSVEEFELWRTFDAEHCLPDIRAELLAGMQAHTTANFAGKRAEKPIPFSDFMWLQRKASPAAPPESPVDFFRNL